MPITTPKTVSDPYARLSWSTSIVLVALQKLKKRFKLREDESSALEYVASEFDLLSRASRLGSGIGIPPNLRRGFCTLVAIQESTQLRGNISGFGATGIHLNQILEHVHSGTIEAIPEEMLVQAQDTCAKMLRHLNQRRPSSAAV
ncbi:MAG: hypothetical protein ACLQG3_09575 [Terracidiphilus sp.]